MISRGSQVGDCPVNVTERAWGLSRGHSVMRQASRALVVTVLIVLGGMLPVPIPAAYAKEDLAAKCLAAAVQMSPEDRIAACTAMIDGETAPLQRLVWARLTRADAYLKTQQFDLAIGDYDRVILQFPDNIVARLARAYAHCRQGNIAASLADYEDVIGRDPQNAAGYLGRAGTRMTEGDLDGAIADYERAMKVHPDNVQAYLGRSAAYRAKDDLDRAIADCNKAIAISPERQYGYLCRGSVYRAKDDLDHAMADFVHAVQLDPKDLRAKAAIAGIHQSRGEQEAELAALDEAIRLNSQNAWIYRLRGFARIQADLLPDAIEDLHRSIELDPKWPYTRLWLEIALQRSRQPSQLADAAKGLDMEKWPAPLIRLFLRETTVDAVLAAADDLIISKKRGQVCEANFYAGELALSQGAVEEAGRLLRLAVDECPRTFIERSAAKADLRRL